MAEPARGGSGATARARGRRQPTARGCARAPSGGRGGNRRESAEKEQHELLVLEPDAGDEADEQPLPLVPAAEDPGHEVARASPRTGRRRSSSRGDARPPSPPRTRPSRAPRPPVPSAPRRAPARSSRRARRRARPRRPTRPAARAGLAEHPLREAAEQRRQRRLVVVSPGWMSRSDAEVQLVPVVAVAVRRGNEQQQLGGRDRKDERPGDS